MKQKKTFKGFTLIEMILVVTIIAILATSVLVGLGGARTSARNSRRVGDLRNIQNALELYYNKNGYYCPTQGYNNLVNCLQDLGTRVPTDPLVASGWRYYYAPLNSGGGATNQQYVLGAKLEGLTPEDSLMKNSLIGISVEGQQCGKCFTGYCVYCVGS